ncbi:MAG: site-2 protease family protein [Clostridia bacterium]|nr:site-2 protease family protein [Clostridia bacterium]
MQKIRIHPLFIALCLFLLVVGKGFELGASALAVAAHECGHFFSAKKRGFVLKDLSLMPYGAVMYAEDGLPDRDGWAVALAGPAVNLLVCATIGTTWWFFPQLYPATKTLFIVNAGIGLFNLLPCYPLDGGRILLSLAKNKKRCLLLLRGCGYFFGVACAALFIVGLFVSPTVNMLILSVMFFVGAASETKKENFRMLVSDSYLLKDMNLPIEEKTLYVRSSMKVARLLSSLGGRYLYRIFVVKGNKEIAYLEGQAIEKLFLADRSKTVEEYLDQNNLVGV